jgi:PAS domain-containing protein
MYEFLHQDDAHSVPRLIDECMNCSDRSAEMTVKFRHADGSWSTISGMAKQLPNYDGAALVVLNWRDVTDRVLQKVRVKQSEEKFARFFSTTRTQSRSYRGNDRNLDVNEEWLRLFRYTYAEVIRRDPVELGRWADSELIAVRR